MDPDEMRRLVAPAHVARLATIGPSGPHVVPFVFALKGDTLYSAVDAKPKRSPRLQRLENIARDARVSVVVDHFEDDWTKLWWVRMDGHARILEIGTERDRAVNALRGKYVQYRKQPLDDAVIAIDVERWTGWRASG
ncbi:MAG TPA: TIGR03668 family PPOX class F420-dependent oxidoreductase [Candidatus Saccharimonadaceae bacterium]|nr:TIGR03668 family PPOX class F420-dependent oxidoreductase [Candidatus Saccharimonadaceae bacterium]